MSIASWTAWTSWVESLVPVTIESNAGGDSVDVKCVQDRNNPMIDNTATYLFILFLLSLRCSFNPSGGFIPPKYDLLIYRAGDRHTRSTNIRKDLQAKYGIRVQSRKPSAIDASCCICTNSAKRLFPRRPNRACSLFLVQIRNIASAHRLLSNDFSAWDSRSPAVDRADPLSVAGIASVAFEALSQNR